MKPPPVRRQPKSLAAAEQDPQVPLRQGFLVANKYGLIEPLGTGSMGAVWKASHVMLGHMVAIKFLHASIEAYPEGRVRFEREAKLSARLGESSRHICRVTDFGVIGSGTPFVVMELLQGEELSTRLRRERQLPMPLIVEIVAQLCRALTVAHQAGVIHRDLKPANVFLCNSEDDQEIFVKLLDFGVAKAVLEHEDTQSTRAGTIFGTPGYMSPEQIVADAELDARSDLWSVAVMAYRMAIGRTPFGAGGLSELGLRILSTNPALPSSLRPDLPKGFDEWMKKGLAKRREYRFRSATELSNALVNATGTRASEPPPDEARVLDELNGLAEDSTYKALYSSQSSLALPPSRSRRLLPVVAGAVVLTAAALAFMSARVGKDEPAPRRRATLAESVAPRPSARSLEMDRRSPNPSAAGAPAPPAAVPVASAVTVQELLNAPDAPAPRSSASATPALRKRATKASKPAPRAGAVEKRASELWNKKDEL